MCVCVCVCVWVGGAAVLFCESSEGTYISLLLNIPSTPTAAFNPDTQQMGDSPKLKAKVALEDELP